MKLKKKKKSKRMRGSRTHGYAMKKHKGKGNRGGKGMSGTGKRADQKKTFVLKYMFPYFGKKGNIARKKKIKEKRNQINLDDIIKNLKNKKEAEFKNYKILGRGEVKEKITIKAKAFSKKAKEKIEKAGGKAIVLPPQKSKISGAPKIERFSRLQKVAKDTNVKKKEEKPAEEKKEEGKEGKKEEKEKNAI